MFISLQIRNYSEAKETTWQCPETTWELKLMSCQSANSIA